MDQKTIKIRRVPKICNISDNLTKHIDDHWGIAHVTWRSAEYFWWVAFCDNKWVAYIAMRWHNSTQLYLGPAFVKENFRGLGLQSKLIRASIAHARRLKISSVIASTDCDNYFSSNNLIKAGFRLIKPWLDVHGLYWELKL